MTSSTPAHDFLKSGLTELIGRARENGIDREVAVAVLTDLITGSDFNDAAPDPSADSEPRPPQEAGPSNETLGLGERLELLDRVADPSGNLVGGPYRSI